jgi:hypothetical protein
MSSATPSVPGGSRLGLPPSVLDRAVSETLERVAATHTPVLCLDCWGPLFARLGRALHRASGRERLVALDLRSGRDQGLGASLAEARSATSTTLTIDGIEFLSATGQELLCEAADERLVCLVSATSLNLDALRNRWRMDWLALVSTVSLRVPVLARRGDEIPEICRDRVAAICERLKRPLVAISPRAALTLSRHAWPGDLAELEAVLTRTLLALDGDVIEPGDLRWDPEDWLLRRPAPDREPAVHAAPAPDAAGKSSNGTRHAAASEGSLEAEPHPAHGHGPAPEALVTVESMGVELAHQLKNPMVTIKTFVQNAAALVSDPEDFTRFRALTEDAVARMDETLEQLLAFSRLGTPRSQPLDLLAALRDALRETWSNFASKQVSLVGPNGVALMVCSDPTHVGFALRALSRHVLESVEARSTLRISLDASGELSLGYREAGATTHLRGVTGTGPASLPLALLLVRAALDLTGGTLKVRNQDGDVTICIRLPADGGSLGVARPGVP